MSTCGCCLSWSLNCEHCRGLSLSWADIKLEHGHSHPLLSHVMAKKMWMFWKWNIHHDGRWSCKPLWNVQRLWLCLSQRHDNLVGQFFYYFFNCCATPNSDIHFIIMKEATLQKHTSWSGSESLWRSLGCMVSWFYFGVRYNERGVRTGVRWCSGWRSVIWSL